MLWLLRDKETALILIGQDANMWYFIPFPVFGIGAFFLFSSYPAQN
jgi:hypothetical protein